MTPRSGRGDRRFKSGLPDHLGDYALDRRDIPEVRERDFVRPIAEFRLDLLKIAGLINDFRVDDVDCSDTEFDKVSLTIEPFVPAEHIKIDFGKIK